MKMRLTNGNIKHWEPERWTHDKWSYLWYAIDDLPTEYIESLEVIMNKGDRVNDDSTIPNPRQSQAYPQGFHRTA